MLGTERPVNNKLGIELLGEAKFKGGERKTVTFMVCRGTERKVVSSAASHGQGSRHELPPADLSCEYRR